MRLLKLKFIFIFTLTRTIKGFDGKEISISNDNVMTMVSNEEAHRIQSICGKAEKNGRKYPWAVSILHKGNNKIGGSIISPYHILTVAHGFLSLTSFGPAPCTYEIRSIDQIRERVVSVGDDCNRGFLPNKTNTLECYESKAKFYKIKSVIFDNEFIKNGCRGGHDWAVVEVDNPIEFNERVKPICLPYPQPYINDYLIIVSWGKQEYFKKSSPLMRVFTMRHDKNCQKPLSDAMPTNIPDYLCAKSLNTKNVSSSRVCLGDSGSGVQQIDTNGRVELIGITSYGSSGCPVNELARITRVDVYLQDICYLTGICYTLEI